SGRLQEVKDLQEERGAEGDEPVESSEGPIRHQQPPRSAGRGSPPGPRRATGAHRPCGGTGGPTGRSRQARAGPPPIRGRSNRRWTAIPAVSGAATSVRIGKRTAVPVP